METLTFQKQMEAYATSQVLLMTHGAALVNIVFMPEVGLHSKAAVHDHSNYVITNQYCPSRCISWKLADTWKHTYFQAGRMGLMNRFVAMSSFVIVLVAGISLQMFCVFHSVWLAIRLTADCPGDVAGQCCDSVQLAAKGESVAPHLGDGLYE